MLPDRRYQTEHRTPCALRAPPNEPGYAMCSTPASMRSRQMCECTATISSLRTQPRLRTLPPKKNPTISQSQHRLGLADTTGMSMAVACRWQWRALGSGVPLAVACRRQWACQRGRHSSFSAYLVRRLSCQQSSALSGRKSSVCTCA